MLVKQHGFTVLRNDLRLTRGLLGQLGDNLSLEIDEEEFEARAHSLAWRDRQRCADLTPAALHRRGTRLAILAVVW